jgi:hypothetical protein
MKMAREESAAASKKKRSVEYPRRRPIKFTSSPLCEYMRLFEVIAMDAIANCSA